MASDKAGQSEARAAGSPARSIHLFGAAALAVSQPILETFGGAGPFFFGHRAEATDIVIFAAVLGYGPPALLALAGWIPGKIDRRLQAWTIHGLLGVLSFVYVMRYIREVKLIGAWPGVGIALVIGLIIALLYRKHATLRFAFTALAVVSLAFPAVFLWRLAPAIEIATQSITYQDTFTVSPLDEDSKPPVFLLIFDELSTLALLDEERTIDRNHFPNFARFAEDAVWFRNGTASALWTFGAVPAIASGRNPLNPQFFQRESYRANVSTILYGAGYQVHAGESIVRLCPPVLNSRVAKPPPAPDERARAIVDDVRVIVPHIFVHRQFRRFFTPIGNRWMGFDEEEEETNTVPSAWAEAEEFLESLDDTPGTFYYQHFGLPHTPYSVYASGTRYVRPRVLYPIRWMGGAGFHFERYMHQSRQVDAFFGRFVDRLKTLGIYDDALIVVVADHGVTYRDGIEHRLVDHPLTPNSNDVLKVPTLFKLPGSKGAGIDDQPFASIDVLPTMLGNLGVEVDVSFDGRNVLDTAGEPRPHYRFQNVMARRAQGPPIVHHQNDVLDPAYDVDWKFRDFDRDRGYTQRSDYDHLIGSEASKFEASDLHPLRAGLVSPRAFEVSHDTALRGVVEGAVYGDPAEAASATLAIALDGVVVAVTQPRRFDESWAFAALLPEEALTPGEHVVDVYAVESIGGESVLRGILIGPETLSLEDGIPSKADGVAFANSLTGVRTQLSDAEYDQLRLALLHGTLETSRVFGEFEVVLFADGVAVARDIVRMDSPGAVGTFHLIAERRLYQKNLRAGSIEVFVVHRASDSHMHIE